MPRFIEDDMDVLIREAAQLEQRLHDMWVPVAIRHHHYDEYAIRLARMMTRAHRRWLRRKHRFNPNDPDVLYANVWYEIYNKIPPWKTVVEIVDA